VGAGREDGAGEGGRFADEAVDVDGFGAVDFGAGEGEQPADEFGAPFGGVLRLAQQFGLGRDRVPG
jgi:hypothetical protein